MSRFDYQVQVAVQIHDRRETHRVRTFVGVVEAGEEADVTQLGAAADRRGAEGGRANRSYTHNERSAMRALLRQGDILLVPIDKVPAGLSEIPRDDEGRIILAEGEATGHLHAIDDQAATFLAADVADLEQRYLAIEAEQGVELTHPEHDTVRLEAGAYEVRRQREYSQAGGIELVAD